MDRTGHTVVGIVCRGSRRLQAPRPWSSESACYPEGAKPDEVGEQVAPTGLRILERPEGPWSVFGLAQRFREGKEGILDR